MNFTLTELQGRDCDWKGLSDVQRARRSRKRSRKDHQCRYITSRKVGNPHSPLKSLDGAVPCSGSQTMACVLAHKQGWKPEFKSIYHSDFPKPPSILDLTPAFLANYVVKNDIHGLITSVNDGSTSMFMWEWFTTKPHSDMRGGTGEVHFVRCPVSDPYSED